MSLPPTPPVHYGVLLYPGFEVLDIAGPIECLNTLNHHNATPGMTLSIIGRPADPSRPDVPMVITPFDPTADPKFAGTKTFQAAQQYLPTHTFSTAPKELDMVLIPGGFGSLPATKCEQEIAFLKDRYPSLKYVLTICTGVGIAAAAGILDGKKATGNKAVWKDLIKPFHETCWIANARWISSGNVWTTSGVSAGTDGMIAFLAMVYAGVKDSNGNDMVDSMVDSMEYNRQWDWRNDPFATIYGAKDRCPSHAKAEGKCEHR